MILLAVIVTLGAVLVTILVSGANLMSSNPTAPFYGAGLLIAAWLASAIFWLAWWVN